MHIIERWSYCHFSKYLLVNLVPMSVDWLPSIRVMLCALNQEMQIPFRLQNKFCSNHIIKLCDAVFAVSHPQPFGPFVPACNHSPIKRSQAMLLSDRPLVQSVRTLASSKRPSAFNKLPRSLRTQYRSWKTDSMSNQSMNWDGIVL